MSCVEIYSCYHSYHIGIYKQAQNHFKSCIFDNIDKMRTSQLHLRVVRAIARFRCDNTKLASDERFLDPVATWYIATRRICDVNTELRYRKPCDVFPGSHPLLLTHAVTMVGTDYMTKIQPCYSYNNDVKVCSRGKISYPWNVIVHSPVSVKLDDGGLKS